MTWILKSTPLILMLLVTGCADGFGFSVSEVAPGISAEDARASRCAGWRVIEPTATDVDTMSDHLVRSVLGHNINGVEQG